MRLIEDTTEMFTAQWFRSTYEYFTEFADGRPVGCGHREIMSLDASPIQLRFRRRFGESGDKYTPTPYQFIELNRTRGRLDTFTRSTGDAVCRPSGSYLSHSFNAAFVGSTPGLPGVTYSDSYVNVNVANGLRAIAIQRMYADAKHNKIQLGETLAELAKSVSLISTLAKTLANSYYHMRRGNFKEAINVLHPVLRNRRDTPDRFRNELAERRWNYNDRAYLKRFASGRSRAAARKWLAWHYGVIPVVMDIDAAHRLYLLGLSNFPSLEFNSTGTAKLKSSSAYSLNGWAHDINYERYFRIGATWRITDISKFNAGQIGFSNQDIPRLLWALVPGSFIVDWLVDIDGFLSSLSVLQSGLLYVHGYETNFIKSTWELSRDHTQTSSSEYTSSKGSLSGSGVAMQRSVTWYPPIPMPIIRNPLSINHATTIVAILNGAPLKSAQQR